MVNALTILPSVASRGFMRAPVQSCFRLEGPSLRPTVCAWRSYVGKLVSCHRKTQPPREVVGNSGGRAAIPEFRHPSALAAAAQDLLNAVQRALTMAPDERIRALVNGDG